MRIRKVKILHIDRSPAIVWYKKHGEDQYFEINHAPLLILQSKVSRSELVKQESAGIFYNAKSES